MLKNTPKTIRESCHPRKAPCPKCGKLGRRKRIRIRRVRSIAFQQELWREVHYGEYSAKCQCCGTFRLSPEDIEPKAKYDNKVRQAVIDRILVDKLNSTTAQQALVRECFDTWKKFDTNGDADERSSVTSYCSLKTG